MILTGFEVGVGVAKVLLLGIGTITREGSCQHCRQSLRRCSECDKIHSEAGYSRAAAPKAYLRLAGNDEMEKSGETTIIGYVGTTVRIHSFIPS